MIKIELVLGCWHRRCKEDQFGQASPHARWLCVRHQDLSDPAKSRREGRLPTSWNGAIYPEAVAHLSHRVVQRRLTSNSPLLLEDLGN